MENLHQKPRISSSEKICWPQKKESMPLRINSSANFVLLPLFPSCCQHFDRGLKNRPDKDNTQ
jgi:hypothetical protein